MSEAAIRAAIKTRMEAVPGIGVVHNRRRYARSLADYFKLMTSNGVVNGWTIHRITTPSKKVTLGMTGQVERVHQFEIVGVHEFDDANDSESVFQAILDGIFEAFKGDPTLGGACARHDQLQINEVDETAADELGGDIFHTADCSLMVTERVSAA